ncbi:MAG TPA: hypothetical protein VH417_19955 [Vicinamibacterales bacterium]|jgi:hypothetical protein
MHRFRPHRSSTPSALFVYDQLQAHLVTAQQRIDTPMAALNNRVE